MVHTAFYRGLEAAQHALAAARAAGALPAAEAARAHALADAVVAAVDRGWACRAGCAHCCHHPVGITWPEALRLAAAIAALPAAAASGLRQRVVAAAAATATTPWLELARSPCPLLVGDRCAVYTARPLPCRSFGSTDATACAEAAQGRPVAVPFDRDAFGQGLGIGSALAGDRGHRELRAGLAAVLGADAADAAAAFASARPAGDDAAS